MLALAVLLRASCTRELALRACPCDLLPKELPCCKTLCIVCRYQPVVSWLRVALVS